MSDLCGYKSFRILLESESCELQMLGELNKTEDQVRI